MFRIIISITTVVSLCLLAVLLNITTPATAGPFGILLIFFFAYMLSLGVVTFFVFWASRIVEHLSAGIITKKPYAALTFKNSYYFSTIIAAVPILLMGLQSVGAIGIYEFILVFVFVVIGCLYISKRVQ